MTGSIVRLATSSGWMNVRMPQVWDTTCRLLSGAGLTSTALPHRRAIEYIDSHLDQNLSLTNIAETVGMSLYYFSRASKESRGDSGECAALYSIRFCRRLYETGGRRQQKFRFEKRISYILGQIANRGHLNHERCFLIRLELQHAAF